MEVLGAAGGVGEVGLVDRVGALLLDGRGDDVAAGAPHAAVMSAAKAIASHDRSLTPGARASSSPRMDRV